MGETIIQDQPHAGALPDLRGDHRADPFADLQRLAPQPTGHGHHLPVRRDSAAGLRDSGGALRLVTISLGEDRETAAQTRCRFQRASRGREGRTIVKDIEYFL